MQIDIITLFPEMFKGPFDESILKRAQDKDLVKINIHNLRKWTKDERKTVDDRPYGGGVGMVMMVEPIDLALRDILMLEVRDEKLEEEVRSENSKSHIQLPDPASHIPHPTSTKIILLSPRGKVFNQEKAREFSKLDQLILICGHYEGVDERVSEYLIDEEISIGDYVLTGGEIPAMVITDAVSRLIPEVLESEATEKESFSNISPQTSLSSFPSPTSHLQLEYPQYTRPENYKGWKVPEILLGGNHAEIEKWRKEKALEKTKQVRPELVDE